LNQTEGYNTLQHIDRGAHAEYLFVVSQPPYISFTVGILQAEIPRFSQTQRSTYQLKQIFTRRP